jgi:hypothetical protein
MVSPFSCLYSCRKLTLLDTPLDLGNETGTGIVSKIKISLSLIQEPEDSFKRIMENVDATVSRLKDSQVPAVVSTLGNALLLTKNIMDVAANVCYVQSLRIILCFSYF